MSIRADSTSARSFNSRGAAEWRRQVKVDFNGRHCPPAESPAGNSFIQRTQIIVTYNYQSQRASNALSISSLRSTKNLHRDFSTQLDEHRTFFHLYSPTMTQHTLGWRHSSNDCSSSNESCSAVAANQLICFARSLEPSHSLHISGTRRSVRGVRPLREKERERKSQLTRCGVAAAVVAVDFCPLLLASGDNNNKKEQL